MRRIKQINELLRSELARLINREVIITGGLITVSFVDCSSDLHYAKIGISVLPNNLSGTALRKLKGQSGFFSQKLKKKLNFKYIPKFNWEIDGREKRAAEIEAVLKKITKNKQ